MARIWKMKKGIKKIISKLGYSIHKTKEESSHHENVKDITEQEFWDIYNFCKPYTMTSVERMYALYSSVKYILSTTNNGAFVECGVWRGGSSMLIAKMLVNRKIVNRKIYLYDTFEGMSEPTDKDIDISGLRADKMLEQNKDNRETSLWCLADLRDVKNNMKQTNYPGANIIFIQGKVEDTIPENICKEGISILRLDTDWYESTKHELIYLYPKLEVGGVLIIDDYGHWAGCKKAVDEYLEENKINILLNRVDYTARVGIKNQEVE
ncbi:MAG: class I SAM-dependent methyltransferase [Crocinitomicaceae bacterium]|nr:class I SAM-dependent methyltransferase [Crocinitomicaceae bacterium]